MTDARINNIFKEIRGTFSPDEKWMSAEKKKLSHIVENQYDSNLLTLFFTSFKMSRKFVMVAGASLIFLAGLVGIPVAAQAKEVGPGDLLYPVDLALENVELAMSSKKGDMVLLREQLDERIEETEDEEEGSEEVSEAVELYNQKVEELEALLAGLCEEGSEECDEDMVAKIEHVGFATLKHVEVLAGVYDKQIEKGNDNAADAILGAMEKSLNGHDQAVESLQKSKENSDDEDEESTVTDEELKAGKDKAKQKIEQARARGRGRNK